MNEQTKEGRDILLAFQAKYIDQHAVSSAYIS